MDSFIARQPIFDRHLEVQAYELLFRSGLENVFPHADLDHASAKVIADSLLLPRLDSVSCGKQSFINVTRELLLRDHISVLPPGTTVIELLESIKSDRQVLETCRHLKGMGFRLALDDFSYSPGCEPLLDLVDIVKVDVVASDIAERAAIAHRLQPRGITLLAEKVETKEVYWETLRLGYQLFQGYFFARPTIISGRDIPASKRSYLQLLREIHVPDLDYRAICDIVEREVALSYKLLRYINSAAFGRGGSVSSIWHALLFLGVREIKRWASVIALAGIASEEPGELISLAVQRGRFCELLAPPARLASRASDLFLIGLFSLIDAILEYPLPEILEEIPIAADAKAALLGEPGPMHDVLELVIAYTVGNWPIVGACTNRLGISEDILPDLYESAIRWSDEGSGLADLAAAA